MTSWVIAAAAGLAVWLALPARPASRGGAWSGGSPATWAAPAPTADGVRDPLEPAAGRGGPGRRAALRPAGAAVLASAAAVLWLDGSTLALGIIAVVAGASGWQLVLRGRQHRAARERSDRVVEVCEVLAGELRAGRPPLTALRQCVEAWPEMAPVATTAELGGDVPRSLRRLAELPGASGLVEVAGAWRVSQSAGGTMALALARVADGARRRRATEQLVAAELASARATARLVAALPVGVLALGSGFGGDPWHFLLATPLGLTCLGAGLALALLGLAWIERIAARAGAT